MNEQQEAAFKAGMAAYHEKKAEMTEMGMQSPGTNPTHTSGRPSITNANITKPQAPVVAPTPTIANTALPESVKLSAALGSSFNPLSPMSRAYSDYESAIANATPTSDMLDQQDLSGKQYNKAVQRLLKMNDPNKFNWWQKPDDKFDWGRKMLGTNPGTVAGVGAGAGGITALGGLLAKGKMKGRLGAVGAGIAAMSGGAALKHKMNFDNNNAAGKILTGDFGLNTKDKFNKVRPLLDASTWA